MHWRSTQDNWGQVTVFFHWVTAIVVCGLFGLGLWMADLDLYHPWYHDAPHIHKSIGVLLFVVTLARLIWVRLDGKPAPLPTHSSHERQLARLIKVALYILMFSVMLFGYLISTADGRAIDVFNWFSVPATLSGIDKQEDIAGIIHLWLAVTLISVATLHALAAFKHHFIDKDRTLQRMLGR